MSGLIDSITGLAFGESLQWSRRIGNAGLIIVSDNADAVGTMASEAGDTMITEDGNVMVTETT